MNEPIAGEDSSGRFTRSVIETMRSEIHQSDGNEVFFADREGRRPGLLDAVDAERHKVSGFSLVDGQVEVGKNLGVGVWIIEINVRKKDVRHLKLLSAGKKCTGSPIEPISTSKSIWRLARKTSIISTQ